MACGVQLRWGGYFAFDQEATSACSCIPPRVARAGPACRRRAACTICSTTSAMISTTPLSGLDANVTDVFEKNDSFRAKIIALPFNPEYERRFTGSAPPAATWPARGPQPEAGKTLIVDLLSGQFDSVLGIFDANGNLLAADDDGGVGLLSRIEFIFGQRYVFHRVRALTTSISPGTAIRPIFGVGATSMTLNLLSNRRGAAKAALRFGVSDGKGRRPLMYPSRVCC